MGQTDGQNQIHLKAKNSWYVLSSLAVQEPSNEEEDDELTPDRDVASSGAAEVVQRQPAKPRPTSRPKAKAVGLKSTSTKKKAPSK